MIKTLSGLSSLLPLIGLFLGLAAAMLVFGAVFLIAVRMASKNKKSDGERDCGSPDDETEDKK